MLPRAAGRSSPNEVIANRAIEMAGGVPGGKALQAVLVGGAAGVFIGPDKLDMPLTYEDGKANGVSLGSGALMVFDETADLREALGRGLIQIDAARHAGDGLFDQRVGFAGGVGGALSQVAYLVGDDVLVRRIGRDGVGAEARARLEAEQAAESLAQSLNEN